LDLTPGENSWIHMGGSLSRPAVAVAAAPGPPQAEAAQPQAAQAANAPNAGEAAQEDEGQQQQHRLHLLNDHQVAGPASPRKHSRLGKRKRYNGRNTANRSRRRLDLSTTRNDATTTDSDNDASTTDSGDEFDGILHTPKKRKLQTTSKYIYENLFVQGKDFDVTVTVDSPDFPEQKSWRLHKLYLGQSLYFQSMFNPGSNWAESSSDEVTIQVMDPNVTLESLDVALGSLYQDEITVEAAQVTPILAAANLLQLEGLIDQCLAIMHETINVKTVVNYYQTAIRYGATVVKESCLSWLKVNLLSHMPEHPDRLREIPPELMAQLVSSPELFVMQTEFSVYVLLRLWLYLKFHEGWEGNPQEAVQKSHKYFQERVRTKTKRFFLETREGRPYVGVFHSLRLNHLVNHHMDMEMLLTDRIIPKQWMYPVYQGQWRLLLRTDQGIDKGPQDLSNEQFDKSCLRCGRTLNVEGQQHMWRWTGFGMGLDLIVTYNLGYISLKRNLGNISASSSANGGAGAGGEHEALLSNHKKRHVYYRITVVSLNEQKQVTYKATSDVKSISMGRNFTHEVLKIDTDKAKFPLLLSFNFVVNTPLSPEEEQGEMDQEDEEENEEVGVTEQEQQQGPAGDGQQAPNDVINVPA